MSDNRRENGNSHIIRNIASFLTLSDAASLYSFPTPNFEEDDLVSEDSWAVGEGYDPHSVWDLRTPAPGLMAVSPGATPRLSYDGLEDGLPLDANLDDVDNDQAETEYMEKILREKRRRWAQQKLASAVFTHPSSLRSFCMDAFQTAVDIRHKHEQATRVPPELDVEPIRRKIQGSRRRLIMNAIIDFILHNLPVSILIDVLEALGETAFDTAVASYLLTGKTLNAIVKGMIHIIKVIWEFIVNFNPFQLLETVVSFQFNAMERTSEALATGIQSVATGMGSASSMALHRLSAANLSANKSVSTGSLLHDSGMLRPRNAETILNKKLLKKLSSINDAARVVSYMESEDRTGGLSKQARSKVQRMMHYDVSLRPFVATVEMPMSGAEIGFGTQISTFENEGLESPAHFNSSSSSFSSDSAASPSSSPFMCTPQSFPPTPQSRNLVLARGSRFADDVVYLARDRLRLHAGGDSENEKTRDMAKLLREGKRLAVFNSNDLSAGVELSCGFHIATKVGNMLYASARSMVPVLRNCYVYFEMTVLPRPATPMSMQQAMITTLSIGLSTEEMPNNTLVGAWQGSCGLCTTGQILVAGQWCTPMNPSLATFSDGATVGCLVRLDDESAVDTWEGLLVTATATFNVDGTRCSPLVPPATRLPFGQQTPSAKKGGESIPANALGKPPHFADESQGKSLPSTSPPMADSTPSPHLPLLVPAAEELYPTVSLHSPETSVLCRFSAEDILATSREAIGAPPKACVYAVDGSVVFEEE